MPALELPSRPFALIGHEGHSRSKAASRGARISELLSRVQRLPPSFGSIVLHDEEPNQLPQLLSASNLSCRDALKIKTFDFFPHENDREFVKRYNLLSQTLDSSLAHASLLVNDEAKQALLVQLQGNLIPVTQDFAFPLEGEELKAYNSRLKPYNEALAALFLAAKHYCTENGLQLHLPSPNFIKKINHQHTAFDGNEGVPPSITIDRIYGSTRSTARKLYSVSRSKFSFPKEHFYLNCTPVHYGLSPRDWATLVVGAPKG
jgi:hypothetical protein